MKKLMLFMLAAMLGIVAANAQGTGTVVVANGTETESDVPINGWYADYYQRSQIIYPASMLTDIVGSEIHGITYYLQTPADEAFDGGVFVVKIGTTSATAFDDAVYIDASSFTTVYTGTLDCTQDELTINFLSPYVYSGESLVIEIAETTPSENYPSATFYGIESEGGSLHGNVSSYSGNSVDDIDDIDVYDFIPKTGFIVPVNCAIPTITSVTPTDVTAVIAWSGDASSYSIKLDNGSWTTVTGNTHTFSDLTSNTQYTVYLRSICGEGDTSMMATTSFRTSCVTQTLPYEEDFDAMAASAAPSCWTVLQSYDSYYGNCPLVSTTAARIGNGLQFYANSSNPNLIASPMLDRNANTCLVAFDAKLGNYEEAQLITGVMTNPSDASTFVALDTIYGNVNADTWKSYEVDLSIFDAIATSDAKYVVFKFDGNSDRAYMDNLVIRQAPSCKKPSGLEAAATNNSLTMSWTENGSATKWVVKVGDGEWTEVRDNPYEITGLTANTDYVVSVRAFCDPDTSDAVSGTFRTLCDAEAFPYSESFESFTASNVPDCWTNIAGTTTVVENGSYSTYAYDGTKALSISGGGVIASPVINVNRSDVYVNFELKRSSSYAGTLAVGIAASPALVNDAVYFDTIEPDNTNYANYEYIFHNTLNLTSGCLIFKQLGSTSTYYYFYIDSLTVSQPPACAKPTNLEATVVTDNSLTLSWTEAGSASMWVMKVNNGEWTEVRDNPYELTGLTANTEYAISVRAFCDPDTSDAVSGTFRTICGKESLPYSEDFSELSSGIPDCWEQVASNPTSSKWNYTSMGNTNNGLYFEDWMGYNSRLIFPVVDCSSLTSDGQLRFSYKSTTNSYDAVITANLYYRTSSTGEWTEIDTWSLSAATDGWVEEEIPLPNSANASYYQVSIFATGADTYSPKPALYIDDIYIEETPACARPASGTIGDIDPHSAVITWDAVDGATEYSVAYSEANDVDDATVVSVNDTTKTLEGLDAETTYYVWVRTVCGSDNANWFSLGSFTTEVACAEVTGLSMTEATTSSITIGWTIDGSTGYESTAVLVSYKEADASDWTETVATGNSFTLENLGEGETYNIRVRNVCGNDTANYATLTASSKVCGEVADASTTLNYVPTYPYYKYSYTQSIYTDAEVGDIDTISGISFKYSTSLARTVDVYIADVANASFDGGWIDISNFTQVATNYAWNLTTDWSEIVFETPFVHQPGNDIVIAIDDNTGNDNGTYSYNFKAHTGKSYYTYNDNTNFDPAAPGSGTQTLKSPDIRFTVNCGGSVQPQTCDVPTGLAANNVTANSAVISWTGNAAEYEVELNGQASTVATNSYNATGLTAATDYAVRVRALCDGGLTSDWTAMVNFTTLNGGEQPTECTTPTGLAVSNITETSASISWNEVAIAETFDGEWNLAMGAEDSVHTMITPDATMHTLLNYLGMDFEDVDENVSVAGTLVPVTIEPAAGNQMNVTGSFDMAMYGVDDPVTFHFSTTGTVTSTGMTIEPATINETVRIMNAMDIDYTGTLTFVQPTALPENGTLTIGIASMNISGYGDTTVNMGIAMTGSVSISMVGTDLTASGTRETANAYPTYELVVTNVATGVETPINNATTPYALQGLTASTDYTVKVRTHCDENSTSEWSAAVSFTTLNGGGEDPTCDVPTNIVIDQESINTPYAALITWNGTASQYEIEITGGEQPVTTTVSTNSYTFNGVASTTYSVRVRAICDGGVTSDWSAAQSFTTPNGGEPQGIDDVNASYSVNIYPNPAKNTVTISVDGLSGKAQVSVIDMSGRTVMTSTMESDATQLNVSKLAQGTYFVRINGENISTVRKLVVR